VAGFGTSVNRPIYGRGPSPGLRFTVYAILSLVLMYLDLRSGWSQRLHYALQAAAYPVQEAVHSPAAVWRWLGSSLETRHALEQDNVVLRGHVAQLQVAQLRLAALERENQELRALHAALPTLVNSWLVAEVIGTESSLQRQRLIINRGGKDGVHVNQAVIDGHGIVGQVMHVGPWSSEVILVTDPEHALPVQVVRNGLRTIAVGSGNPRELLLSYLAVNSDVLPGDQLISSGLGGVYPAGFPVGRITGVHRGAKDLVAQVQAEPAAQVDRSRELMLIDFTPGNPAAPPAPQALEAARAPDATEPAPEAVPARERKR